MEGESEGLRPTIRGMRAQFDYQQDKRSFNRQPEVRLAVFCSAVAALLCYHPAVPANNGVRMLGLSAILGVIPVIPF